MGTIKILREMEESKKLRGRVKFFNAQRGFGFIKPDDGSEDLFVHQSNIHAEGFRTLAEDEEVEFDVEEDQQGKKKALNVTGPNGAYVQGSQRGEFGGGRGGFDRGGFGGGRGFRGGGRGGFDRGFGGGFRGS